MAFSLVTGHPLSPKNERQYRYEFGPSTLVKARYPNALGSPWIDFFFIKMEIKFRNSWMDPQTFIAPTLGQSSVWEMGLVPSVRWEALGFSFSHEICKHTCVTGVICLFNTNVLVTYYVQWRPQTQGATWTWPCPRDVSSIWEKRIFLNHYTIIHRLHCKACA